MPVVSQSNRTIARYLAKREASGLFIVCLLLRKGGEDRLDPADGRLQRDAGLFADGCELLERLVAQLRDVGDQEIRGQEQSGAKAVVAVVGVVVVQRAISVDAAHVVRVRGAVPGERPPPSVKRRNNVAVLSVLVAGEQEHVVGAGLAECAVLGHQVDRGLHDVAGRAIGCVRQVVKEGAVQVLAGRALAPVGVIVVIKGPVLEDVGHEDEGGVGCGVVFQHDPLVAGEGDGVASFDVLELVFHWVCSFHLWRSDGRLFGVSFGLPPFKVGGDLGILEGFSCRMKGGAGGSIQGRRRDFFGLDVDVLAVAPFPAIEVTAACWAGDVYGHGFPPFVQGGAGCLAIPGLDVVPVLGDARPVLSQILEELLLLALLLDDGVVELVVAVFADVLADQVADDLRLQSIELPALIAVLVYVAGGAAVGQLGRVRGRVVELNLIHVESQTVEVDALGLEGVQPVDDVAAHVLPTWVMIAEVEEDDVLTLVGVAPEPPGSSPHFRLRDIPAAGKEADVELSTYLADDSDEGVFLHPHLDIVLLALPVVEVVGIRSRVDHAAGRRPVRVPAEVSRPVLNGLPVDQAGKAGVADQVPEVLVAALVVGDDGPGYHLVVDLPERQAEALPGIVTDDAVDPLNQAKTVGPEVFGDIFDLWHGVAPFF